MIAAIRRLCAEPLVQFLILGGLIFAADALLSNPASDDDQYRIRVTQQHLDALEAAFRAEQRRPPSEAELQVRLQQWLDEQMLYQQAKSLGLNERDAIVRRQMIQKMRFLLADAVPVPDPAEAELQAFLDEHRERYGHSPRLSFEQVFFSRGKHADDMELAIRQTLGHLQQRPDDFAGQGDPFAAGQTITAFDQARVRREFGRDFYARIVSLTDHEWHGPIASSLGLHMVRITGRSDFRPALLDEVRARVENDWRIAQREKANAQAMERLRSRFRIEYENINSLEAG